MRNEQTLTPDEAARHDFFRSNQDRLCELGFKALQKGLTANQFVVTCIDVDDPTWKELVKKLMPVENWQRFRDRGEKPVIRTIGLAGLIEYFNRFIPDITPALNQEIPEGLIRAVSLGNGGASVYYVEPKPQYKNN